MLPLTASVLSCSPPEDGDTGHTSARAVEDLPVLSTFAYECDDGTTMVAHYEGAAHVWLFLPSTTVKVPHVPSASGAKYGDETLVWWSRGPNGTLERADRPTTFCREQRRRSIIEDAKLRGADYWATGNEPGWTLEIASDSIRFVTGYATEHYRFATPPPTIDATGQHTVWHARASDHTLTIEVGAEGCADSMSGEPFAGTVTLTFDDQQLRGCGTPLH